MDIGKRFLQYVSLNVLGMIGLSCYILGDTYFISKGLQANGLAALNLAISIYSLIHGVGLLIGIGGGSTFAVYKAKKETIKDTQIFSHAMYLACICSILFIMIGVFFSKPLSMALGANQDILSYTNTYIKTILCFSPLFIFNNITLAFVRNDGNPKLAMLAMLVGSFSNILLDYIFIFPLQMGMFGAAFATCLAPLISLLILSIHYMNKTSLFEFTLCPFRVHFIKDIIRYGLSSLINECSSCIVLLFFNLLLLRLGGNIAIAAYGIVANIALVVIAIFTGIGQGIQPLISEAMATKQRPILHRILHYAIFTSLSIACIVYLGVYLQAPLFVSIFNNEGNNALASLATHGLEIYFIGFFFVGINISLITFFSTIKHTKTAFIVSLLRGGLLIIPLALLFSSYLSITGVWLSFVCSEALTLCFGFYYYLKSKKELNKTLTS